MEALVAISLTSNVVQFVQFARQLLSDIDTIQMTGNPASLPQLRPLAENLTRQAELVKTHLQAVQDLYLKTRSVHLAPAGTDHSHLCSVPPRRCRGVSEGRSQMLSIPGRVVGSRESVKHLAHDQKRPRVHIRSAQDTQFHVQDRTAEERVGPSNGARSQRKQYQRRQ